MHSWCTNPCVPAPVQGLGSSIALASSLIYTNSLVFFGSFIGMLIHICLLVGYANPLLSTILYVSTSHITGYIIVSFVAHFAHTDAFLPTAAMGVTIILIGTILAVISRSKFVSDEKKHIDKIPLQITLSTPPENIHIRQQPEIRERLHIKLAPPQEECSTMSDFF